MFISIAALVVFAVGGILVGPFLFPAGSRTVEQPASPVIQIVRQQRELPDFSKLVERLCPSIAVLMSGQAEPQAGSSRNRTFPMFAVSADGWLLVPAPDVMPAQWKAIFGDGRTTGLSEIRTDPVSGLAIIKAEAGPQPALTFDDQAFPRVGQFGLAIETLNGRGCTAHAGMIEGDFLADGGAASSYVRLQIAGDRWKAGLPVVGTDGRMLGVSATDPEGAVIPALLAATIINELARQSLSPSTGFGFRAIDYPAPLSTRLGTIRSGASIAMVQPKSGAADAGLRAGDIVIAVNSVPISSASELNRDLDAQPDAAALTLRRDSQQFTISVRRISSW